MLFSIILYLSYLVLLMLKSVMQITILGMLITLMTCVTNDLKNDTEIIQFPQFDQYLKLYEKKYDQKQYEMRKELYYRRLKILDEIQYSDLYYRPGINKFSDWNEEEIASLSGLLSLKDQDPQNTDPEQDPTNTDTQELDPEADPEKNPDANLVREKIGAPSSVDWRLNSAVTQVKDQGNCGSCWAFAAVAYAESKIIIDGRYSDTVDLAQQRLLQCTASSSCGGGYLEYAIEQLTDQVPFEFIFPYNFSHTYGGNICTMTAVSIGEVPQNYYGLSISELQELVAQRPITISLSADGWVNYGGGIYSCNKNPSLNHGVLLVGYTQDYWIIKNSWGPGWGDNGYIYITKQDGIDCLIGTSAHRTFEFHIKHILPMLALMLVNILL